MYTSDTVKNCAYKGKTYSKLAKKKAYKQIHFRFIFQE